MSELYENEENTRKINVMMINIDEGDILAEKCLLTQSKIQGHYNFSNIYQNI